MNARRRQLLLAVLAVPACAGSAGVPELQGGIEMGVRRGANWTTLKVALPHIIGPRTNLVLRNGLFTGSVDGRGLNVRADEDGLTGAGPFGSVAVSIEETEDAMVITGTWNGARVHLRITNAVFRGTVPVASSNMIAGDASCQYVLDTLEPDGAWSGSSICNNLPEQTRLEVPAPLQGWLSRPELAGVILVLLSSPPVTMVERGL